MKIAIVTDDGETISSHFGRAKYYQIITVEDGQIVDEERIEKPHHTGEHHDHDHQHEHDLVQIGEHEQHSGGGHSPGKFKLIADCKVLLCGGMGEPAYNRAVQKGHQVFLTGGKIQPAVESYLSGKLESDLRRIHKH
jgi:predicted Fe-Mo cluster-binding NifX family protein